MKNLLKNLNKLFPLLRTFYGMESFHAVKGSSLNHWCQ